MVLCLSFSYYNLKILEWISKKNLILELIQENSIKNSVQNCLSYIPKTNGLYFTTLAYPTLNDYVFVLRSTYVQYAI